MYCLRGKRKNGPDSAGSDGIKAKKKKMSVTDIPDDNVLVDLMISAIFIRTCHHKTERQKLMTAVISTDGSRFIRLHKNTSENESTEKGFRYYQTVPERSYCVCRRPFVILSDTVDSDGMYRQVVIPVSDNDRRKHDAA